MLVNIVLLLSIVGSLVIGLTVYLNNKNQTSNKAFFLLATSTAIWVAFNLATNLSSDNSIATWFARLTMTPTLLIGYSIWILSYNFPFKKTFPKALNLIFLVIIAILAPLSLTRFNIIESSPSGSTFETGVVYFTASLFFIFVLLYALVNYLKILLRTHGQDRQRVMFVIVGFFASALLGFLMAVILPVLGITTLLQAVPTVIIIMLASFSYAILRHKLFDIRAVVVRSVTYALTIILIGLIYGFTAFRIVNIFLINTSLVFQQAVYTILAVILAFLFQPIRRFFEKVSNSIFYRGKYDAQQLVNEIGRILTSEIQLDELSKKVLQEITGQMKIDRAEIVILGKEEIFFLGSDHGKKLMIGEPETGLNQRQKIKQNLQKLGRLMVVADELSGGERRTIMKKYGISVSLALRTSEQFLGYLLLGEKKSGDIYNDEDLKTLKIIANELSVGLQNAKAFAEIQAFNVTLQQRINEATRKLRHANDQLKELDKAKDEFISMASHQLRTPLTTIKGYVSMLDEGDFGKLTKPQREPLELALDGANRMARLIDDLLNVSRMEAGKFFIEPAKIDLNKIVPEEINQLQTLAETRKVELTYIPPKHPIPIMNLDENKTRQVIMNLADNAVHYSTPPAGGGKVEVHLERDGDDIVYIVRDNGIGVPLDQQAKLFSKMFRARNAQEVRPDGTGLGLYLVKRVVEDQGGKIIFESEPGKGSAFGFRMPIHNKIIVDKEAQKKLVANHNHNS